MKRYRANYRINKELIKYGNVDVMSIKKRELIRNLSEKLIEDENYIVTEIDDRPLIDDNNFEIDVFMLSKNEMSTLYDVIREIKDLIPFDKYTEITKVLS